MLDLSTSLLGIFKSKYIHIVLTNSGDDKYNHYCQPDEFVTAPLYKEDFTLAAERGFWTIAIDKIYGQKVDYNIGEDELSAICYVVHTPMRWNYWHFSICWLTEEGFIHNEPAILKRNWVKRLSHATKVFISQYASIIEPINPSFQRTCFDK